VIPTGRRFNSFMYEAAQNQCCGSGMFIPDPDFYPSRIPDPKSVTKERGEKKFFYHTFFCSHKFHKIEYYVFFEMLKKKILANFQRIVEVFTQKIFNMLSNIWVWDPRSGIRKKPIPDPGSRGQKGTGSRIRIRNTAQNFEVVSNIQTRN
jgi:hypothetical protein